MRHVYDVTFTKSKVPGKEIKKIGQDGYAVFAGSLPMIKCVSSAVLGHDNYPVGVILAVGPLNESRIAECGTKLLYTALNFSAKLGNRGHEAEEWSLRRKSSSGGMLEQKLISLEGAREYAWR